MMRLSMNDRVQRTIETRNHQLESLVSLENEDFVVTIGGQRQDDAMLALVKPALERELLGRTSSLDRDLVAFGVDPKA